MYAERVYGYEDDSNAGVGDGECGWHEYVSDISGSGIVFNVLGMKGVGGLCEMCML